MDNHIIHGFGLKGVSIEDCINDNSDLIIHKTHQVHGREVHILGDKPSAEVVNGDAFLTNKKNVVCCIRTADCVPILVADPKRGVVGAVHAGWKGTALNIADATIKTLINSFGSDPGDIIAMIGPAICEKCYEVSNDVIESFASFDLIKDRVIKKADGKSLIDLKRINQDQFVRAGLPRNNIDVLSDCTCCDDEKFASYRRDKTKIRQVSFIFLRG